MPFILSEESRVRVAVRREHVRRPILALIKRTYAEQERGKSVPVTAAGKIYVVGSRIRLKCVEPAGRERLTDVHKELLEIPAETQLVPSFDGVECGAEIVVGRRELKEGKHRRAQRAHAAAAGNMHVRNCRQNGGFQKRLRKAEGRHVETLLVLRAIVFVVPRSRCAQLEKGARRNCPVVTDHQVAVMIEIFVCAEKLVFEEVRAAVMLSSYRYAAKKVLVGRDVIVETNIEPLVRLWGSSRSKKVV